MFNLSIIVPANGTQSEIDNTLVSVLENRPADCEVLVPHNAGYQDPYDLGDEVAFVSSNLQGLAGLLNAAIAASQAPIIHVLMPGTEVSANWSDDAVEQLLKTTKLAALAPQIQDLTSARRIAGAGVRYTSGGKKHVVGAGHRVRSRKRHPQVDGPLLQAAFIRRDVFDEIGWLTGRFGDYHIDTDLAARLHAAELRCQIIDTPIIRGTVPKAPRGFSAGRRAESLYRCHSGNVVAHGWHVACDFVRQLPSPAAATSVLGRCVGRLVAVRAPRDKEVPTSQSADDQSVTLSFAEARDARQVRDKEGPDARYSKSA